MHPHVFSVFGGLSVVVAIFAAWTALDLFRMVRERQGTERLRWLATAALAMGGGVWAMHFIAMLGFDPGAAVSYDPTLTIASFLLAVIGTSLAFTIAARGPGLSLTLGAGTVMGLSICGMHYVGMAAMKTAVFMSYSGGMVLASAGIALTASVAALYAARRERSPAWRFAAAVILGMAVVGMHYTAMLALEVTPMYEAGAPHAAAASPVMLAVAVAAVTMIILILALAASMIDQRDKLLSVIDAGGVGYWELSLPDRSLWISDRARSLLDVPADAPFGLEALTQRLSPEAPPLTRAEVERILAEDSDYEVEHRMRGRDRWLHMRGRVIRSRSGRWVKLAGVIIDVTERHLAFAALSESEHRQRLLINELNHRVKNTLATIQSIAALTARRTGDAESFMRLFEARLMALSETHNLLTANGWETADLRDLVLQELRPYAEERVSMTGPPAALEAEQALAMALILHELTTNAAKYGALSDPDGRIEVVWGEADAEGVTAMEWREVGVRAVPPPTRTGFGTRLINTSVRGALKGTAEMDYADGRLRCRLTFRAGEAGRKSGT
ncbi:MHYT domain-containing protein [Brevundimonas faecalis]|uniref:MHYT domain-containing protein n=1 Tax=Brevundimonas faecalis TaxID=947378 RepID=UPI00360F8933